MNWFLRKGYCELRQRRMTGLFTWDSAVFMKEVEMAQKYSTLGESMAIDSAELICGQLQGRMAVSWFARHHSIPWHSCCATASDSTTSVSVSGQMDVMHSDLRRRMSWYVDFSWSWGSAFPSRQRHWINWFVYGEWCLKRKSCVAEFCISGGAGAELPIWEASAVQQFWWW